MSLAIRWASLSNMGRPSGCEMWCKDSRRVGGGFLPLGQLGYSIAEQAAGRRLLVHWRCLPAGGNTCTVFGVIAFPNLRSKTMPKNTVLSPERVEKMQSGRKVSSAQRAEGVRVLVENPQFQNYRFWKNVDEEIISGIVKAIDKASAEALRKKIAKLEGEIAGLRNQL